MNEWEFTADVASLINELIRMDSRLPRFRARCEQTRRGEPERRDLTLVDRDRRKVLTGEVKLPYSHDGGSSWGSGHPIENGRDAVGIVNQSSLPSASLKPQSQTSSRWQPKCHISKLVTFNYFVA